MKEENLILGIDPGTNILGYGLINCVGKKMEMVDMGVLKMTKLENHELKLKHIFEGILDLIEKHNPDFVALEAPFFGKNVQSMLKLGRAQGVAMAAALYRGIPIAEYSPKRVKQSITGSGNASKEQVAGMLKSLLTIKGEIEYLDATDGLAVAVCHYFSLSSPIKQKSYSGWEAYLSANPKKKLP